MVFWLAYRKKKQHKQKCSFSSGIPLGNAYFLFFVFVFFVYQVRFPGQNPWLFSLKNFYRHLLYANSQFGRWPILVCLGKFTIAFLSVWVPCIVNREGVKPKAPTKHAHTHVRTNARMQNKIMHERPQESMRSGLTDFRYQKHFWRSA